MSHKQKRMDTRSTHAAPPSMEMRLTALEERSEVTHKENKALFASFAEQLALIARCVQEKLPSPAPDQVISDPPTISDPVAVPTPTTYAEVAARSPSPEAQPGYFKNNVPVISSSNSPVAQAPPSNVAPAPAAIPKSQTSPNWTTIPKKAPVLGTSTVRSLSRSADSSRASTPERALVPSQVLNKRTEPKPGQHIFRWFKTAGSTPVTGSSNVPANSLRILPSEPEHLASAASTNAPAMVVESNVCPNSLPSTLVLNSLPLVVPDSLPAHSSVAAKVSSPTLTPPVDANPVVVASNVGPPLPASSNVVGTSPIVASTAVSAIPLAAASVPPDTVGPATTVVPPVDVPPKPNSVTVYPREHFMAKFDTKHNYSSPARTSSSKLQSSDLTVPLSPQASTRDDADLLTSVGNSSLERPLLASTTSPANHVLRRSTAFKDSEKYFSVSPIYSVILNLPKSSSIPAI